MRLPPVVAFAWPAIGWVIEPMANAGAPCAMQTARRSALVTGAAPAHGSVPRLVSPVTTGANSSEMFGARTARALFATGEVFSAEEAQAFGLVSQVLGSSDEIDGYVSGLVRTMRACAPGAVGDAKRLVHHVAGKAIDRDLMEETAKRIARARVSEEGQEGVRAFLEKRKPAWTR